jgi:hypothetical protein
VQVVLETLLGKLRAQGGALMRLAAALEPLAVGSVAERMQFLERRFNEMFGEPGQDGRLSPFRQQEVLDRIGAIETLAAAVSDGMKDLQEECHTVRCQPPGMCAPGTSMVVATLATNSSPTCL